MQKIVKTYIKHVSNIFATCIPITNVFSKYNNVKLYANRKNLAYICRKLLKSNINHRYFTTIAFQERPFITSFIVKTSVLQKRLCVNYNNDFESGPLSLKKSHTRNFTSFKIDITNAKVNIFVHIHVIESAINLVMLFNPRQSPTNIMLFGILIYQNF